MYDIILQYAQLVRGGVIYLTAHPDKWTTGLYADWLDDISEGPEVCAFGAMGYGAQVSMGTEEVAWNELEWLPLERLPTVCTLKVNPEEDLNAIAAENGLTGSPNMPIHHFNDHVASSVDVVIDMLTTLADLLDHWAEWQAEVEGLTPMTPITMRETVLVPLRGGE